MKTTKIFREKMDRDAQMRLALELGLSFSTIQKWYYYDNDKFAHLRVIKAINKVTGLTQEEMFEEEKLEEVK